MADNTLLPLDGRLTVVTGAARGIGRAIAAGYLAAGATVALIDSDGADLERTVEDLSAEHGGRVSMQEADLTQVEAIHAAIADVAGAWPGIDALVNNVGGSGGTPLDIEQVTEADYDAVLDLNVKSCFFATKAVIPHMRARGGGSIINLASISGRAGIPWISPQYSASKGAILALTRNLATKLGPEKIRVNAIAPGYIRSGPRVEAIWASRDERPVLNTISLRRRGEAEEIATVATFLASDAASYITGATLDVNGGSLAL